MMVDSSATTGVPDVRALTTSRDMTMPEGSLPASPRIGTLRTYALAASSSADARSRFESTWTPGPMVEQSVTERT